MIIIKSKQEIAKMKEAGQIVAKAHAAVKKHLKVGMTTYEIDQIAKEEVLRHDATLAFKGYGGFPGNVCISINEEVVHGIPSKKRKIKDGDIVSVDIGAYKGGYYGDAARTHAVGKASDEALDLIQVTKDSFFKGIEFASVGNRLSDISHAIQEYCESRGYSVVRKYVGHGIGRNLHEDPQIPNYGPAGRGPRLKPGMVLAIEPMVNIGSYDVITLEDHWTVVTVDKKLSAHYEHTIVITEGAPEILTQL